MAEPSLLQRFPKVRVAVIGDLVADEYVFGETERVSREAPVLIVRHEATETKLGGAANAAANVAALGAIARPVGIVGQDAAGSEILRQFRALGADVKGIVRSAGRHTETKTRILAGGRSTTRQQMLRVDRADERPLTDSQKALLRRRLAAACDGAQALMVSDYGGGLFDETMIALVQSLAAKLPVCVDSRYSLRKFGRTTLVKPNEPELEAVVGARLRSEDDVERAGRRLLEEMAVPALVVTRGRHGMWLFQPGKRTVRIPVWGPEEAVDVTGAGDTVLATLACALGAGASPAEAAALANVAGGIVVQKPGTATCSREELAQAIGGQAKRVRA